MLSLEGSTPFTRDFPYRRRHRDGAPFDLYCRRSAGRVKGQRRRSDQYSCKHTRQKIVMRPLTGHAGKQIL